MPPNSRQTKSPGRWRAIALSILVHSLIVAAAVLGWFTWKHKPPEPQTLAIEASVVDESALTNVSPPPEPAPIEPEPQPEPEPVAEPEPAPPEEQGPPRPDPEEVERRRQEEERIAAEKRAEEEQRLEAERIEAEKKEAERKETERIEAEKKAAARAAAEKAAAEKKRAEEAAARKAAEEKARQAREAELRRSLEAEERRNAARNSEEAARWHAAIISRVTRAWIRPPAAVAGVNCVVLVSQVPGGEVTSVRVDSCNPNDAALRESVEAAVLRASPLPTPPPGVPFERNLRLIFAPQ